MDILRTPTHRFENLPGYDFNENYVETNGLRLHYLDEGKRDGDITFLCLHGEPTWSYLYRKMVKPLAIRGRVLVPDLIGFGKSDKPTKISDYSFRLHFDALASLLEETKARNLVLVCQDWGGLLGLPLAMEFAAEFKGLVIMNTGLPDPTKIAWAEPKNWVATAGFLAWRTFAVMHPDIPIGGIVSGGTWPPMQLPAKVIAAYDAPFPDKSYKAGADAFPRLVPLSATHPTLPFIQAARAKLENSTLRKLVLFSNRDPITWAQRSYFEGLNNVVESATIENAGHFLQEDKGEELAAHILRHF